MNPNTPVTDDSSSLEEPINVGRLDGFTNVVQGSDPNSVMFTGDAPIRTTKKSYGFDSVHWLPHSLKRAALVIAVLLLFFGSAFGLIAFLSRPGPKQPTIINTAAPAVSDTDRNQQNQGTLTINRELLVTNATTFEKTITVQGNTTVGQDLQVQGNGTIGGNLTVVGNTNLGDTVTAGNFIGNGSGLTGIQAGNCNDCTRQQGPITSAQTGNIHIAGSIRAANFIGDGSQLTGIPTGCDTCVALQDDPFAAAQIGNASLSGRITAGSLFGDGSGLNNLNATNILAGVLNDARLSGNVALLNAVNNFTAATNSFAGSVGIGTASPLYPLDVVGDINSSTALRVGGNVVCTSAGCTAAGAGTGFLQGGNSFAATAVLGTNDNNSLALRTNGVERLRVDANGNVGVGTTAPASKLHVADAGTDGVLVTAEASPNNPRVTLQGYTRGPSIVGKAANGTSSSPLNVTTNQSLLALRGDGYGATGYGANRASIGLIANENWTDTAQGTAIVFSTTLNGTTTGGERLRIDNTGNVGIGTTAPGYKLAVSGGTGIVGQFSGRVIGGNAVNSNEFTTKSQLDALTSGTAGAFIQNGNSFGATAVLGTNDANDLQLETGGTTKLTIQNSTGNVGIGTTGPSALLHIGSAPLASVDPGLLLARTINSGTGNARGFEEASLVSRTGTIGYNSYDAIPTFTGSTFDHYAGFQSRPVINISGTMNNLYGAYTYANLTAGTVTNYHGYYVANPLGAGTATNVYGLYVASLTKGVTDNFAVYTAGTTKSYFGGNVGIGTTTPNTFKLEVAGNIGPEADNTRDLGSASRRFANIYASNIQGAITPTGFTQGSVAFAGPGGVLTQDNANFFFDDINERLHIGARGSTAGTRSLNVYQGGLFLRDESGVSTSNITSETYGLAPSLRMRRAQGTLASPTAVASGQSIGQILGGGYGSTGFFHDKAQMIFSASETWTDTAQGTAIGFSTTLNGTTTTGERLRINNDGNVGIGTTAPGYKLEVRGTGNNITSGSIQARNTADTTSSAAIVSVASGTSNGASGYLGAFHGAYNNGALADRLVLATNSDAIGITLYATGAAQDIRFFSGSTTERVRIDSAGNVGIGTTNPGNLLSIGTLTTPDGTGKIAVSTGGANNKGIIIQAVAGQNVDLLQAQDSTGAVLASIDKVGNLTVKNATINGTLTVNGHIITANASGTTTIAAGAAACTTPTVSVAGNDTAGTITITTGTGCAATGVLGTVTFATAYGVAPRVVISADNADATNLKYYTSGRTTASFDLSTNNAPTDATTYTYNYQVLQ